MQSPVLNYRIAVFDGIDDRQMASLLGSLPSQISIQFHPITTKVRDQEHLGQILESYNGAVALYTRFEDALNYVFPGSHKELGFEFVVVPNAPNGLTGLVNSEIARTRNIHVMSLSLGSDTFERLAANEIYQQLIREASLMKYN